jgi:hypothetical protein
MGAGAFAGAMRNEEPHGPPEPEPPRREFHFKPTEFEITNRPADDTPGNAPIDVQQFYRQAGVPSPSPAVPAPVKAENEVHAILRANVAQAEAEGLNKVVPQPRRLSRRKRDYWLLLVGGNLLVVGLVSVLHKNVVTLAFGFGAMIFCSLALTWVTWVVLDDY